MTDPRTAALRRAVALPLVRNTGALVLNTGLNAVLGLGYWVVAARLYAPGTVGLGAGAISGMMFVASVGWIGLQQVLLRYLPVAGPGSRRLIGTVYAAAMAIALGAALAFLAYASGQPTLSFLTADGGTTLGFLGAVAVWVVFSLQDPSLIGLGRAPWVPIENLAFGAAKLGLLAAFAGLASPWAIFGSWILGAAWLVVVVNALLRRLPAPAATSSPADPPGLGRIARFAIGQHVIAVVVAAPDSLAPLLILALLGDEATAFYYAAWTISFSVRLLAVNLGSAVTVEGASRGGPRSAASGTAALPDPHAIRRLVALVIVPAVALAWMLAGAVMSVYGARYATEATDLLRLLLLAVVPFTGVTLFVVGERLAERTGPSLAVAAFVTATTLALDVVLLPRIGIAGAGVASLSAQIGGILLAGLILARRARPDPNQAV